MRDKIEKFIIESEKSDFAFALKELSVYTFRLFLYLVIVLTIIFLLYILILDNEPLKRLLE